MANRAAFSAIGLVGPVFHGPAAPAERRIRCGKRRNLSMKCWTGRGGRECFHAQKETKIRDIETGTQGKAQASAIRGAAEGATGPASAEFQVELRMSVRSAKPSLPGSGPCLRRDGDEEQMDSLSRRRAAAGSG